MNLGNGKSGSGPGILNCIEYDGDTGYFYALDEVGGGNPIKGALHIYNAEHISDGHIPFDIKIGWTEDSKKCVLLINRYPHGVFYFDSKNRYYKIDFPPSIGQVWSVSGHEWDNKVDYFSDEPLQSSILNNFSRYLMSGYVVNSMLFTEK